MTLSNFKPCKWFLVGKKKYCKLEFKLQANIPLIVLEIFWFEIQIVATFWLKSLLKGEWILFGGFHAESNKHNWCFSRSHKITVLTGEEFELIYEWKMSPVRFAQEKPLGPFWYNW